MWIAIKLRIDCSAAAARRAWLKRLRRHHSDRIMPISERVSFEWGGLAAERPRGIADRLIAATAMVHVRRRRYLGHRDCGDQFLGPVV